MYLIWKIWVDAKTEEKALKLLNRVAKRMEKEVFDGTVEHYPKTGGFVVCFSSRIEAEHWNDAVVETIGLSQRIGHSWFLTGSIYDDPEGWSNKTNISGVDSIRWTLIKDSTKK
jgi:hypothetical protein